MAPAAFFDMDRTLLRCNSGTLWIKYLRRRGEISRLKMLQALGWIAQYKLAILDMESVTGRVTATMAGERERDIVEKCLAFTETEILSQVAPAARERIAWHRARGHVIAILSSSTPYVTEPLARHLDIPHVLCTRLHVDGAGRFIGTHVRPACYGAGKVHWAEEFARREGVDLDASFFYTDSFSDLPMLERVGVRRVINPDTRLRRHARRVGWSVEEW
jgi:HAD superfamily hydrolase (TIGR01490 family)